MIRLLEYQSIYVCDASSRYSLVFTVNPHNRRLLKECFDIRNSLEEVDQSSSNDGSIVGTET